MTPRIYNCPSHCRFLNKSFERPKRAPDAEFAKTLLPVHRTGYSVPGTTIQSYIASALDCACSTAIGSFLPGLCLHLNRQTGWSSCYSIFHPRLLLSTSEGYEALRSSRLTQAAPAARSNQGSWTPSYMNPRRLYRPRSYVHSVRRI